MHVIHLVTYQTATSSDYVRTVRLYWNLIWMLCVNLMEHGPFSLLILEVKHTLWGHGPQIYNLNFPWRRPLLCASKQGGSEKSWSYGLVRLWPENLSKGIEPRGGREEYGLCKHAISSKGMRHNNLRNVSHLHLHRRISHVERRCWCNLLWVHRLLHIEDPTQQLGSKPAENE